MYFTQTHYTEKEAKIFLQNCDKEFDARVDNAVDLVLIKKVKFVCLSGPSCAGKTTTANKIIQKLADKGIVAHSISLDDFFYDMDYLVSMSQKKGCALDMDSADAIDLKAFAMCLDDLVNFAKTELPIFDFHTHSRSGYRTLSCNQNDVIIFEGIQAIYPEITSKVAPYGMVSIFVCPDQAITVGDRVFEPNIYRFYRRIVRDAQYRSASAARTLEVWRGVRNNEDAHIFPYRDSCDMIVDSSMAYDIHLLTPYLRDLLPEVSEESRYYLRALDILNRISRVDPIPASYLDNNSLYKEFIKF